MYDEFTMGLEILAAGVLICVFAPILSPLYISPAVPSRSHRSANNTNLVPSLYIGREMVSWIGFGSSSPSESSTAVSSRAASPESALATTSGSQLPHAASKGVNPLNPQGLKPCCACPETKSVRDECFLKNSPEVAEEKCRAVVEAHKACMRSYGFKV